MQRGPLRQSALSQLLILKVPYTASIIAMINESLQAGVLCDARFAGGSFMGIACDAAESDGAGLRCYPVVFDLSGNGQKVNPDDTYPIQLYHRLLGISYSALPSSVGDHSNEVLERIEMRLVVMGWANRLYLSQEDLAALITSGFPDQIAASLYAPLKLQHLNITLQSAVMDRLQVFREEYKGLPYMVKPEQVLFALRYQIESRWKKGCFMISDCPSCPGQYQ